MCGTPTLGVLFAIKLVAAPTFYRDVLPILQNRCQECHRPGEIAPMPFTSYREVRPWAKAIKNAAKGGKMPPWFADRCCGKFTNHRTLTPAEIDTLWLSIRQSIEIPSSSVSDPAVQD